MAAIGYGYGSEWHLLQYMGRRRAALTALVEQATGLTEITWLDSQETTKDGTLGIRETVGLEFLGTGHPVRTEWERQWPQTGNVHNWDAIGTAGPPGRASWVLVEAKANLNEINSTCAAKAEASVTAISAILNTAKSDLGATNGGDWTQDYYQFANRVALLHFLERRGIDAHMVYLYFLGDCMELGRAGRVCPTDKNGWQAALAAQDAHVGLPMDSPLNRRIHKLFVPAYRATVAKELFAQGFDRRPAATD